ncbi:MAG: T9SS type A sorting domain-containing protein [Bacteroidales bacterium]|nr:T9SS type A sorting domain-containing protein [Bacteroidales bacterium]
MKRITCLIIALAAIFQLGLAQNTLPQGERIAANNAALDMQHERAGVYLSWCQIFEDYYLYGWNEPMQMYAMHRYEVSDIAQYSGYSLKRVSFIPTDASAISSSYPATQANFTVVVYQGGSYNGTYNPGTLVYSQQVTNVTYNEVNTVILNTPVAINTTQELWIGILYDITAGFPFAIDDGVAVEHKGNIIGYQGDWNTPENFGIADLTSNWVIEGYIENNTPSYGIVDFGALFLDNLTNQNEISSLTVPAGSDFEVLLALWNFNYGAATSDFVNDVITLTAYMDGAIIDQATTSPLSIASGDATSFTITMLTAAEIIQQGLSGTHEFYIKAMPSPNWTENDGSDNIAHLTVTFNNTVTTTYTVTANSTGNGTITPTNTTVAAGNNVTLTITPYSGYQLSTLSDNGNNVTSSVINNTYTIYNIAANHTVTATFEAAAPTYIITVLNTDNTVTPSGTVTITAGNNQTFTVIVPTGQTVDAVYVDGTNDIANLSPTTTPNIFTYTFVNVQASHTFQVTYTTGGGGGDDDETNYTINVINTDNSVLPSGAVSVAEGADQTFTIIVPDNKHVDAVYVDGTNNITNLIPTANSMVFNYTFTNVQADHSFFVTYADNGGGSDDDDTLGMSNYKIQLSIYPNPAKEQLFVQANENITEVHLFDIAGREVLSQACHSNKAVLNISHLKNGIYFARILMGENITNYKFTKQ